MKPLAQKKIHTPFLLLKIVSVCTLFLSFHPVSDNAWKLKKDVDGIKVYLRAPSNCALKELKTITRYKTSLSHLVSLVGDKESYPKWVYGCAKSYVLKKVKATETYHYQETATPWPVSNRDMIVHTTVLQDSITKIVTIRSQGVPEYIPSYKGIVRVPQFDAYWKFTPLKDEEIEVEYFMSLNPGGDIPDWVINLAVAEGPIKTLKNMEVQLQRYQMQKNLSYIKD